MSRHHQARWISRIILAGFSLVVVNSASAAPLACVQRAIDWTKASDYATLNEVDYALVALHESGEGAYANGTLQSAKCTAVNPPGGVSLYRTYSCLITQFASDALLLHPYRYPSGATTAAPDLLPLSIDSIPNTDFQPAHLRQPNATYDFVPACVGNELVGHDQWGNQWTVSFSLTQRANIH